MECSINGRWFIPFKKFGMVRVNQVNIWYARKCDFNNNNNNNNKCSNTIINNNSNNNNSNNSNMNLMFV